MDEGTQEPQWLLTLNGAVKQKTWLIPTDITKIAYDVNIVQNSFKLRAVFILFLFSLSRCSLRPSDNHIKELWHSHKELFCPVLDSSAIIHIDQQEYKTHFNFIFSAI